MYANIRSLFLNVIPGACFSDFIYLGMLVFIISGFISSKKWGPFFITLIFSLIFKGLDLLFLRQASAMVIEQFLHMIILPLIITVLYSKRN